MVDGLSVSRRRLWRSARQGRVRRVIVRRGAAGLRLEDWFGLFGLPNQSQGERVGRMHKNRDGDSHFAIGQSLSDCCRAAPAGKAGRRGGGGRQRRWGEAEGGGK